MPYRRTITPATKKAYAFGSGIKERHFSFTQKYRFGFNKQEQETELGEYYSFEYRVHDARLGRFLSVDPLMMKFPWNSTFAFSENRVIDSRELEGLESCNVNTGICGLMQTGNGYYPEAVLIKDGVNIHDNFSVKLWGWNHYFPPTSDIPGHSEQQKSISNKCQNPNLIGANNKAYSKDNCQIKPVLTLEKQQPMQCQSPVVCSPSQQCNICAKETQRYTQQILNSGGSILTQGKAPLQVAFDNLPDFNKVLISHPMNQSIALAGAATTLGVAAVEVAPLLGAEATAGLKAPTAVVVGKGAIEGVGQLVTGGYQNLDPLAIGTAGVSSPGFGLFFQSTTSWKVFDSRKRQFQSLFLNGTNGKPMTTSAIDFGLGLGFGYFGKRAGEIGNLTGKDKTIFDLTLSVPIDLSKQATRKTIESRTGY